MTLISADRQKFEVDAAVAKMSNTVKEMMEGETSSVPWRSCLQDEISCLGLQM